MIRAERVEEISGGLVTRVCFATVGTTAMKTTGYFEKTVRTRRPYLKDEWIKQVLRAPLRTEVQANGRARRWAYIQEAGRYLRVVTEPDGETVHNAFLDRRFKP